MLLEVQNLGKKYIHNGSEFFAVQDINLSVDNGEFIAICGHSGSGKSTLFNLISGLLKPDFGKIIFNNTDISTSNSYEMSEYRNSEIGYIIQGQSVLNGFNVIENVCLPFYLSKSQGDVYERAMNLLKQVGLEQYAKVYPNQLSGGQMRRVAVARALINSPKLIIADEPTSNLDRENSACIMELFKKISDSGIGVIISTHDSIYNDYVNKALTMDAGKLYNAESIVT